MAKLLERTEWVGVCVLILFFCGLLGVALAQDPPGKKSIPLPPQFDGAKFKQRYSLQDDEIKVRNGRLYYPDTLPDAPVLEAPDPRPAKPAAAITAVRDGTATPAQVRDVLQYLLNTRMRNL